MEKYYFGQRARFENYFLGEIYMLTSKIKPIFSKSWNSIFQNLDSKDSYWKVIIDPLYYYVTIICQFYNVSDVNINCTLGYWFQGKQCCFLENTDITLDFVLGNIKN